MLSRLDDVGAGVRLRLRLTDLADEDVDSVEGAVYMWSPIKIRTSLSLIQTRYKSWS